MMIHFKKLFWGISLWGIVGIVGCSQPANPDEKGRQAGEPYLRKELIFPLQADHVHGSTLVTLPDGGILAAWFQGSGERWADDVQIMGARKAANSTEWSSPFVLADVKDFPDINPVLFIDGKDRLWLVWYTVIANQWETSLINYRISENYTTMAGAPEWDWQANLLVKAGDKTERGILPDDSFVRSVEEQLQVQLEKLVRQHPENTARIRKRGDELLKKAKGLDMVRGGYLPDADGNNKDADMGYPYFRRMGWQTRSKPFVTRAGRMILPLYSDGFSFSLMALTDDWGESWTFSDPLVGSGNIQPAIAETADGILVAYMRDNGPPPKRLQISRSSDQGKTWDLVEDTEIPNPGSAADIITLANGKWVLINNNLESGREVLTVSLSEDEGKTWPWKKVIESGEPGAAFHYPAIIAGNNGEIHVSYSYFLPKDQRPAYKSVTHGVFNEEWIKAE